MQIRHTSRNIGDFESCIDGVTPYTAENGGWFIAKIDADTITWVRWKFEDIFRRKGKSAFIFNTTDSQTVRGPLFAPITPGKNFVLTFFYYLSLDPLNGGNFYVQLDAGNTTSGIHGISSNTPPNNFLTIKITHIGSDLFTIVITRGYNSVIKSYGSGFNSGVLPASGDAGFRWVGIQMTVTEGDTEWHIKTTNGLTFDDPEITWAPTASDPDDPLFFTDMTYLRFNGVVAKDDYLGGFDNISLTDLSGTNLFADFVNNDFLKEAVTGLTSGGNKSTSIVRNVEVYAKTSDIGVASFLIYNPEFTDKASIDALLLERLAIDDNNGNLRFQGEIKRIDYNINDWTAKVILFDDMNKLTKIYTSFSPILLKEKIEHLLDTSLIGIRQAEVATYIVNEFQNNFLTVIDESATKLNVFPYDVTYRDTENDDFTPKDIIVPSLSGIFDNIFYDNGNYNPSTTNQLTPYRSTSSGDQRNFYSIFQHYFSIDDISSLETVKINFIGRVPFDNFLQIDPDAAIRIMNFNTGILEELYHFHDSDPSLGSAQDYGYGSTTIEYPSFVLDISFELDVTTLSDYATLIHTLTTGEKVYSIDLYYYSGEISFIEPHFVGFVFNKVWLELTFNTNQYITNSSKVVASNTIVDILLTAPGMESYYPISDKWGVGDTFVITKPLSEIMEDLWTEAGLYFMDFEEELTITDIQVLINLSLFESYKKYSQILAREFWFDPNLVFFSYSTFASTGITLTEADIDLSKPNTLSLDASNLRNTITVVGDENVNIAQVLTPEATVENEDALLINAELISAAQAEEFATQNSAKFENIEKDIVMTIRLSDSSKDFTELVIGKTIALTLYSFADFTSGGDGELFIKAIFYYQIGQDEYATLTLKRLY